MDRDAVGTGTHLIPEPGGPVAVTGLRPAELVALTIGDIEGPVGAKTIAVRHGKGDKDRAVPIDPRLGGRSGRR